MCGRQSGAFPAGPATATGPSFVMDPTTEANIRRSFTPDGDGIYGWSVDIGESGEPVVLPGGRLGPPPNTPVLVTAAETRRQDPTPGEIAALLDLPVAAARALFDAPGIGWTVGADRVAVPHVFPASATALDHGIRWLPAGIEHVLDLAAKETGFARRVVCRAMYGRVESESTPGETHREAALRVLAAFWSRR